MLFDGVTLSVTSREIQTNLAKLDCGVDQSPTVMVGEKNNNKLGTNRDLPGQEQYQSNTSWIENVAGKSSCYDILCVSTQDIRKGI